MIKKIIRKILPADIYRDISIYRLQKYQQRKKKEALIRLEKKIKDVLSQDVIKIDIGSGNKKGQNGWTTIDLNEGADLQINLLNKFPLPDNSVQEIYSSHFLEHFYTHEILIILKECYRVLKPNGWISACVPDGRKYIMAYANDEELDPNIWLRYSPASQIFSKIDYVNYMGYLAGEHKHLFDQENLINLFIAANFKDVKRRKFIEGLDMEVRDYQSIYVEATK